MIRDEWDLDPAYLTVNHGSYGATPRVVRQAQLAWQDRMEQQPTRFMTSVLPAALREAADQLGRCLNASGQDIVFVDNATAGCNAVLRSLSLRPGEQILLLSHAYGAVRNTVRYVAERSGAQVTQAQVPFPDPTQDSLVDCVRAAITPHTRLAVIDHITSASALVVPVARILAVCHQAGVPVLVDGAHAPGQIDLDLTALGADWYVGNCHKWLCAPKGCGFLHTTPERQAEVHPLAISHGYTQGYRAEFDWTGTTDPSRFLAITEAIAFHERLGGATFRRRNAQLAAEATRFLAQRLNTQPGAVGDMAAAMGTVRLPVADASIANALRIRQDLLQAGTDAPVHALDGGVWLRISAFAYNQMPDFERLADLVATTLRA